MNEKVIEYYNAGRAKAEEQIDRYEKLINRFSVMRLCTIVTGIFLFYQSLRLENPWIPVLVFFLVILGFSLLVRQQNRFEKKRAYFRDLSKIFANELGSINQRTNIYSDGSIWNDENHPYSSDLDIFGKGSLFQLINRCVSSLGNARLAGWLQKPASSPIIISRQEAVAELALMQDWKHHFQAVLLFASQSEDEPDKLFQYMRAYASARPVLLGYYLDWIPLIFLCAAVLAWFYPVMLLAVIALGIINLLITQNYSLRVMKADSQIGKMGRILSRLAGVIGSIRREAWKSALCRELAADLKDDSERKLPGEIRRLSVLINQLAFGLSSIGPVLNFTMVWNVRQLFAIEEWKLANRINLKNAFDTVASFEALISLSSLRSNYPQWAVPEITGEDKYTLEATAIGHPLIPAGVRVNNDYILKNELKIDIITGSNMAGKSTFLRTLGINTVLALAGAPVCAESMKLSPMLVFTYMRIRDSLNENTSTFKAELDRLQRLLSVLNTEEKVFFLIDEMLRGTNSVDKYLGSKGIIEKLISQQAVGIVATHDLQIAELEQQHPHYIRNFYFDIEVDGDEMKFDYKLKAGECRTFNASLLLKRLGIN